MNANTQATDFRGTTTSNGKATTTINGDRNVRGVPWAQHNRLILIAQAQPVAGPQSQWAGAEPFKACREAPTSISGFPRPVHNQRRGPNQISGANSSRSVARLQKQSANFRNPNRICGDAQHIIRGGRCFYLVSRGPDTISEGAFTTISSDRRGQGVSRGYLHKQPFARPRHNLCSFPTQSSDTDRFRECLEDPNRVMGRPRHREIGGKAPTMLSGETNSRSVASPKSQSADARGPDTIRCEVAQSEETD